MPEHVAAPVHRHVEVDADPDDVWRAIVDDDERAAWFGGPTSLTPEEGGAASFTDDDGAERSARVERVVPGRHITWTWWVDGDDGAASRVSIDVTPSGGGTRVDVVETPMPGVARANASAAPVSQCHGHDIALVELEHVFLLRAARTTIVA